MWIIELYDNGMRDDEAVGDSTYTNTFAFPAEGTYDWKTEAIDCNGPTDSESGTLEAVRGDIVGEDRVAMKMEGKWLRGPRSIIVEEVHVIRLTGELEGCGEAEIEFDIVRKTVTLTMAIHVGRSRGWGYFVLRVRVPSMADTGAGPG